MPFVITEPEDDQEDFQEQQQQPESKPKSRGFVITPAKESQEETSYMRGIGSGAKEFLLGALDMATRAFGGGPKSLMARDEQYQVGQDQEEFDEQLQSLQEQGLGEEQITKQIGQRPDLMTVGEKIDDLTGGGLIPRTETERAISSVGKGAGEFVAMNALLPGSSTAKTLLKEAGVGGLFGLGEQVSEEAGGGPVSQAVSGIMLASTPYLLMKGKKGLENGIQFGRKLMGSSAIPEGLPKFLEGTGEKALADLELSSKDLTGRVAKTSEEMLSKFEESVSKVAEPTMKDIGTFRAADIESEIIKSNQKAILDTISPATETQKKSWEGLQKYVEGNFKAVKETYSNLYKVVEEGSKGLGVIPRATFEMSSKIVEDLERSIIKTPEEGGVRKSLQDLVNLLKPMKEGNLVEMPLEDLMAGKRSINRLLEKSDIVPAPVDLLKPISRAMKEDTLKALEARPGIKKAFQAAENQFSEAQRVFNNDSIVKMRKSQNPEELTSMFTKPSNLERMNEAIGENKQVKDFMDRMVVENISSKNKALSKELASESREYLGKKGSDALDKILEYGQDLSSPGQQSLARGSVLQDLQRSFDTGSKPSATLKLMQNPVGYDIVKDTLNRSPKGKKIFKSLQRATFEDMVSSIINKDKQIDFEKAKDILSDPHMKSVIKEAMGEEGLKFFQKLETYGKNMAENIKTLSLKDKPLLNRVLDTYFDKGMRYYLYGAAPFTLGKSLIPVLGADVAKRAYRSKLHAILENPQSQNIIKQMGQKNVSPQTMAALLKRFAQVDVRPSKDEE